MLFRSRVEEAEVVFGVDTVEEWVDHEVLAFSEDLDCYDGSEGIVRAQGI